jgi:hypothetical protein
LNGDGKPDLVVSGSASFYGPPGDSVTVLLGNGDGTFQAGVDYDTGSSANTPELVDFNGDGKLDLVVRHYWFGNSVSVLLGNGDGTFQAHVEYLTGNSHAGLAVADLNGDGKADLAVTNYDDNSVSVLLGNGNGSFQTPVDYATGKNPSSVAVGDFNGDGKPDLEVMNGETVSVLLGNGDGTFQERVDSAGSGVFSGDLNGDGKADLVGAGYDSVHVLLGNGDGTFQAQVDYATGDGPTSVAVGDFNGDGKPDLAVANGGEGSVSVLLGNGDGTFQDPRPYFATGANPRSLGVGNFNGDGKPDLAVTNYGDGSVSVLLGNGDGTFQAHVDYPTGKGPSGVTLADFNGDRKLDLAVTNYDDGSVSVLLGNGDGTFQPHVDYATGRGPNSVTVGDFNGDSRQDLAITNYSDNSVSVLLGNGDGTFRTHVGYATGVASLSVVVGDFNRDGKPDLVVISSDDYHDASNFVSVFLGNGDGTFQTRVDYEKSYDLFSLTVGDFNGDGKPDLAVTGSVRSCTNATHCFWVPFLEVLLDNSDGSFQTSARHGVDNFPSSMAVGDFNSDGKADLAVTNDENSVSVLLGNGDGTFQPSIDYARGQGHLAPVVADLNLDGAPDLAFITRGNAVSILLNMRGTLMELQSSANPSVLGQSIILTATIHSSLNATGIAIPTGTIKFQDGTSQLGTQTLDGNGVASMAIDTLTIGEHDITAVYSGDSNFNPATSGFLTQVVNVPDFALSTSPGSATLRSGSSAVFTITASAVSGFNNPVLLTCSVSPSSASAPTCALSPSSVTPAASGSATAQLTVATTGSTAAVIQPMLRHSSRPFYGLWLSISSFSLLGVGFATRRSGRKKIIVGVLLFNLLVIGLGPQTACGGGSHSVGSSGTPPGQYTVTVNATSGSIAHTAKVTITVQ